MYAVLDGDPVPDRVAVRGGERQADRPGRGSLVPERLPRLRSCRLRHVRDRGVRPEAVRRPSGRGRRARAHSVRGSGRKNVAADRDPCRPQRRTTTARWLWSGTATASWVGEPEPFLSSLVVEAMVVDLVGGPAVIVLRAVSALLARCDPAGPALPNAPSSHRGGAAGVVQSKHLHVRQRAGSRSALWGTLKVGARAVPRSRRPL